MRAVACALFVFVLLFSVAAGQDKAGTPKAEGVKLDVVKYDGLADAILKNRGKVVYVDFWFLNCPPCKKGFPHLVDLYAKHRKDGLEVITVNVNAQELPGDTNYKESLQFLQEKKAVFRNIILDEGDAVWAKKLKLEEFPTVFVFDRRGQWTRFGAPIDHAAMDRFVEKLLKEDAK